MRGGGSSIALSSALPAASVNRSASSTSSDLPAPLGRRTGRPQHERAHLADRDRQPFRHDEAHVRVGAAEGGVARRTHATAAVRALQRGRERARGDRPPGAGWAGEEPGVGHPHPRSPARRGRSPRPPGRPASGLDGVLLADQRVEHRRATHGGSSPVSIVRRPSCGRLLHGGLAARAANGAWISSALGSSSRIRSATAPVAPRDRRANGWRRARGSGWGRSTARSRKA